MALVSKRGAAMRAAVLSLAMLSLGILSFDGAATAQSSGGGYGPGMMGFGDGGCGYGYGYGMMGGGDGGWMMGSGYGRGMMGQGWGSGQGMMWGSQGTAGQGAGGAGFAKLAQARLDALKSELKITSAQEAAWKSYGETVTAAQKQFWDSMSGLHQPGMMWNATQQDRLALMSAMIQLRQTQLGALKAAADALTPHLSEFQKGQAAEILPGLARGGFGSCGMGF